MLSIPSSGFPAFPPVSDLPARFRSLPWERIGSAMLTSALVVAAVFHALAVHLWRNRGSIASMLRMIAAWLENIAAAVSPAAPPAPSPALSARDRSAILAALVDAGENADKLRKWPTVRLVAKAQRLGIV